MYEDDELVFEEGNFDSVDFDEDVFDFNNVNPYDETYVLSDVNNVDSVLDSQFECDRRKVKDYPLDSVTGRSVRNAKNSTLSSPVLSKDALDELLLGDDC